MGTRIQALGRIRPGWNGCARLPGAIGAIGSICCLLVALLAGCDMTNDRIAAHLARADALVAENRGLEALLELRSAAQLAPDDPSITLRVAEISVEYGYFGDGIDFYRDYHALVPDDDMRTIALARLLRHEAPDEANELLDGVLARDPGNSDAWLARAHLALAADDTRAAARHVGRARSIDPQNPEVYWTLARTHEARIRAIRRRSGPRLHSPRIYEDALDAYEKYSQKGGERKLMALLYRADLLARLPKRTSDARHAYEMAIRSAAGTGTHHEKIRVMRRASRYARRYSFPQLESLALEAWVEIAPDDLHAWELLASIESGDATHAQRTYDQMLRMTPENPAAHVLYARHIAQEEGARAGLEYLRGRLGKDLDDAVLWTGIVNLEFASGRRADAARSLRKLRERFPDRHATELLAAHNLIAEARWEEAIQILRAANESQDSIEGQRLLARAALSRGRYEEAMAAIDRAMELERGQTPQQLRVKAEILAAQGEHRAAALTLHRINRTEPLTHDDNLRMARAYYDARAGGVGRRILSELLEIDPANKAAALEFARREHVQPEMREQARAHAERALGAKPDDLELLTALVELDLIDDHVDSALIRINLAVGRKPRSAELYLLRARVLLSVSRFKKARNDAERALAVDPGAKEEALEILSLVYTSSANPQAGILALGKADAQGALSPDRLVLLGRLYLHVGDDAKALATYERAFEAGSRLTMLRNDLAYLLARTGRDLERALALAREASEAPGQALSAADTLGYVYLRLGQPDAAFWQFRYVTANADPPLAEYHYHLALALLALDREAEAGKALKRALNINPQFSSADTARAHLVRISEAGTEAAAQIPTPRSG
ncbi:MAG: tetratricopeptide repeat protein [Deltaproteobacteria bacterium]|nr:tetratricopeptide repeat protein [Deltaproteobacteria bacterium]